MCTGLECLLFKRKAGVINTKLPPNTESNMTIGTPSADYASTKAVTCTDSTFHPFSSWNFVHEVSASQREILLSEISCKSFYQSLLKIYVLHFFLWLINCLITDIGIHSCCHNPMNKNLSQHF